MHQWYCRVCWYEWRTPFQTALTTDPMPVQCPHCHSPDIRNADIHVQGWVRAVASHTASSWSKGSS